MKRMTLALSITALLLPLSGAFTPAEAGGDWHVQTSFRVGKTHFSLGYHEPGYRKGHRGYYPPRPRYYYRTTAPLSYKGYRCDANACYRESKYHYHSPSCGVVRQHFRVNHFVPPPLPYYYAPYGGEVYYYYSPYTYYYPPGYAPRGRSYRRGW